MIAISERALDQRIKHAGKHIVLLDGPLEKALIRLSRLERSSIFSIVSRLNEEFFVVQLNSHDNDEEDIDVLVLCRQDEESGQLHR